ncbi:MAG: hypothetical protein Q8O37_04100 [Sulfuricellaceae bacterium]|nr:hypothetical protein [Sulfuricellaceae bacterium]
MKTTRIRLAAPLLLLLALLISGCAGTMRSYDSELNQTVGKASSGQVAQALVELEKNNSDSDKDLLYFMEKGELLKLNAQIPESRDAWLSADEKVKIWEDEAKNSPEKLIGNIGSVIINDKTRRYDGQDYEKVMLSTRLALDHVLLGNWDQARTEIKKTHEREGIIADLRAKEMDKVESESRERNVKTEVKDVKGYPVETLNDPEVTALKNSYQSAFSHYLAGFVYEALNEPSLAAPGYRKAIELRPDVKFLEEGLSGLDTRAGKRKRNETDVLFVVESGSIPARQSVSLPIPARISGSWIAIPISFPVIRPDKTVFLPAEISIDGRSTRIHPVTNLDAMARRALKDDMPGIILRGTIRAIAKSAAQKAASDKHGLLGLAVAIAAVVTESADERGWRTLPAQILVGRTFLPAGRHTVSISGPFGTRTESVEVAGKYAVVPLRLMGSSLYLSQPYLSLELIAASVANSAAELTAAPAHEEEAAKPAVKKKTVKKNKSTTQGVQP